MTGAVSPVGLRQTEVHTCESGFPWSRLSSSQRRSERCLLSASSPLLQSAEAWKQEGGEKSACGRRKWGLGSGAVQ